MPNNWYETFFEGVTLDLWRKAMSPEQTRLEVDFLAKKFAFPPAARILDVPCGNGRHSPPHGRGRNDEWGGPNLPFPKVQVAPS